MVAVTEHEVGAVCVRAVLEAPEARAAVVRMVIEASVDAELCAATYLPANMSSSDVEEWLERRGPLAWVITEGGEPCGFCELGELRGWIGLELPIGTFEREVWLHADHRGKGVARRATACLLSEFAAAGVEHVLGVAWEENQAAIRGMRESGFERLGRVWWDGAELGAGWCEAWVLDVPGRLRTLAG